MPSKKKTAKKLRAKKPANKKPSVKSPATRPAETAVKPAETTAQPRLGIWVLVLIIVAALAFLTIYIANRSTNEPAPDQPSQSSDTSSSELRVVPEQEGSTSSAQASGALQPQPTGLQQSQPATQSADGLNLQAQNTPDQTTIR